MCGQDAMRPKRFNTRTATIGGSVARLDQANGEVMIQTVSGPLLVRFPTRAIQGLRQGDEVLLKLDLTTASRPSPRPHRKCRHNPSLTRDGMV